MKSIIKNSSRYIGLALSLATILCLLHPISSFAAESNEVPSTFIPLEETDISFDEAVEILGLTPEEAEKVNLYVVESNGDLESSLVDADVQPCGEVTDSSRTYINSGEIFNPGYFTFTRLNTGRYRTLNGDLAKLAFIWKPTSTDLICQLNISFRRYGLSSPIKNLFMQNWHVDENGYETYTTDWIEIDRGWDYNIVYETYDISYFNPQTVRVATIIAVY